MRGPTMATKIEGYPLEVGHARALRALDAEGPRSRPGNGPGRRANSGTGPALRKGDVLGGPTKSYNVNSSLCQDAGRSCIILT